ncbi:MAG: MOSC N-terminal beta barrel domain-containing protein [Mycobacteriales bacterium]
MTGREVGRVAALYRYPVKSMGAQALTGVDVSWPGLAGDRRWAFVRPGMVRSDFPWQTIKEKNDMWQYQPSFIEPERPDASAVRVSTPSGEYDVDDPRLAALLGEGCTLIKVNRGNFDWLPLSLITVQTVAEIGARAGVEIDALRFRPNLLVDAPDAGPFAEDAWVGQTLTIGGLSMRVDMRDTRCVMINVDPRTAERNPAILRVVARERDNCAGVYGSTAQPGRVEIGDSVVLED